MTIQNYVFIVVLLAAVVIFTRSMLRLVSYLRLGKSENRLDSIGVRLRLLLTVGIGQAKLLREPTAGIVHALIFWGFLILLLSAVDMVLEGLNHAWSLNFLGPLYGVSTALTDVFCLLILLGTFASLWRRYVQKIPRLQVEGEKVEAGLILVTIFLIVSALFTQNALRLPATGEDLSWAWRPFSSPFGQILSSGLSSDGVGVLFSVAWWIHAVLILAFMNYLPYSKHLHVLTSLPNVFLGPTSPSASISQMDFEADKFGVSDIEDFSWKTLLDGFTCTHCGRCTSVCPAFQTGKVLDPRSVIVSIHARTMDRAPLLIKSRNGAELTADEQTVMDKRLIGDYISPDALWACTTCGACMQECPVNIEHVPAIIGMRQSMVLMEGAFNEESALLPDIYGSMENTSVPWGGFSHADRAAWAEGLGVITASEDSEMDILYWVGCAGAYDERAKKVAIAFTKLMQKAGVKFRILGTEENCTGDVARRTGNEYLADALSKTNIETLKRYGNPRIVATCPHCLNALKNDYAEYGADFNVVHHSQFINELIDSGRLTVDSESDSTINQVVTYHDSCYLGRYNSEVGAPRAAISNVPGLTIIEVDRNGDRGFCCGAGGGRMFMEEKVGDRVNVVRTRELLDTGASSIVVNCPFCATMITDGVKMVANDDTDRMQESASQVHVKDIAEILLDKVGALTSD